MALDADLFDLEVDDGDARSRLLQKLSLDVAPEEGGLADVWVTDHDYFVVGFVP